MILEQFCPECLDYMECDLKEEPEVFNVKGENIEIVSKYLQCRTCGTHFNTATIEEENIQKAYEEYRKLKNLLQPSEIIDIRRQYGLSQRQFAKLLGWSHATLSRYESGAIQSTSHNYALAFCKDPKNMQVILERNSSNLSEKEIALLKQRIKGLLEKDKKKDKKKTILLAIEQLFEKEPSIYTGFQRFSLDKVIQTVKFFATNDSNLFKVKLMKYLWYSDFLHFKRHTISINGLEYAKLPMGPVPNNYEYLISLMLDSDQHLSKEFVDLGYGNPGERFIAVDEVDYSIFQPEEIDTLQTVLETFKTFTSTSISERSHEETAWIATPDSQLISYEYAKDLSIE